MNLNDPSLYGVTCPQREIATPFLGALPIPWQNVQRFTPPYAYGMQSYYPYGMQHQFGMQPFYPFGQLGTQPFQPYGLQPFVPQSYGYTTPFATGPLVPPVFNPLMSGGIWKTPFDASTYGWQRPFWY